MNEVWVQAPIRQQLDDLVIGRIAAERSEWCDRSENSEASVSALREAVKLTCRSSSYAISISLHFSNREAERRHARVFRSIGLIRLEPEGLTRESEFRVPE